MRKGIVILRPPLATPELRGQIRRVLGTDDWECEFRTRFDGTMAVAFERPADLPEGTIEGVREQLKGHFMLSNVNLEIRELG
jgi:hypothetical protein